MTLPAGANDPCPCGSGKRFKHCHGALAREGIEVLSLGPGAAPPEVIRKASRMLQERRAREGDRQRRLGEVQIPNTIEFNGSRMVGSSKLAKIRALGWRSPQISYGRKPKIR